MENDVLVENDAEYEFLRVVLAKAVGSERAAIDENLLEDGFRWKRFLELVSFHRVGPLVYAALKTSSAEGVPGRITEELGAVAQETKIRSRFLAGELSHVQAMLDKKGIPSLALKGPALSKLAFGGAGKRLSEDSDILIPPKEMEAVEEALKDRGYERMNPDRSALHRRIRFFFEREHHYMRGNRTFNLDVHTRAVKPSYSYDVDFQALYGRAQKIEVFDCQVLSLGVEDLIQIVCLHGTKDRWERLKYMSDLSGLLRRNANIDTATLVERARLLRVERILGLGFYLAHTVLEAPLPDIVRDRINLHPEVQQVGESLITRLPHQRESEWGTWLERVLYPFLTQEAWGAKARYAIYACLGKVVSRLPG